MTKGKSIGKRSNFKGMKFFSWAIFTVVYALFVGILYFWAENNYPYSIMVFGVGCNIQESIKIIGIAGWGMISIAMNMSVIGDN